MVRRLWSATLALFRRAQLEHDIDDELRDHLERDMAFRIARGASPAEARRLAVADLGGLERTRDDVRDVRLLTLVDDLRRDLRFTLRRLGRSPAYTALVIITIGLGVGASTTVFTVIDGVLLKPLPFRAPGELVTLWQTRPAEGVLRDDVPPATFLDWKDRARTIATMAAADPWGVTFRRDGSSEHVDAWRVSDGFFSVLDARPFLGRTFRSEDFLPGNTPVVLLDHGFWQRRLGGDPRIVGQSLTFDDGPHLVVGVMPPNFEMPKRTNLWQPWVPDSSQRVDRFATYMKVFGRMRPEASVADVQAELSTIARSMEAEFPRSNRGVGASIVTLEDVIIGGRRPLLWTLLGAALVLLFVTVVNVGALHLTRLDRQHRETSVRLALGARRSAIVRPLLVEAFVLALAGGALGAAAGAVGVRVLHALGPVDLPRLVDVTLDGRAVVMAALFALVAGASLAIVSARRASSQSTQGVPGTRGMTGSRRGARLRRVAVGLQLALSLVLLIGTSLLVRSFLQVLSAERGYRTDRTLSFSTWIYDQYPEVAPREQFVRDVLERLRALPGVTNVAMGSALPLADQITGEDADVVMEGTSVVAGEEPQARGIAVWPSYFETLGTAVRQGRSFLPSDDARSERVVVVNEAFVRRFSPDRDAVGRMVSVGLMGRAIPTRIVGVVADTRHARLDGPPEPGVFLPWLQRPIQAITFIVRTAGDPDAVAPLVPRTIFDVDPRVAIDRLATLDALLAQHLRERAFLLVLLGVFGGLAVVVACVGVFGVMSQAVTERRREIAVRMALGAAPQRILGEFAREAGWMAAGGVVAGMLVSAGGTTVISRYLYNVARFDPLALGASIATVAGLALLAALLPSLRAARTPPASVIHRD